ncbi:accessory gene regulator ArgB-like protein [Bacillus alveayuensis]|uniref:accessory gene regulator ArgB-like protein n=1 Tax=Aeribacillus alveayuensis TaxID=279215 RepID=UPI0005D1067A|nr:accessory gene regulator B family protein [Bacillus alveayuensis]
MRNIAPNTISHHLADFIAKNNPKYINEKDQIRYGLEWVISGLYQFISVILLGHLFNTLSFSISALISGAMIRMFSGGIHFKKYIKCYIYSTLTIQLTGIFAARYSENLFSAKVYYTIVFLTFIIFLKYAPKLYKTKELFNVTDKKRFKVISICLLLLFFILTEFIIHDNKYVFCIWTSIALQAFTITNIGEKVILFLDKITK